MTKMAKDYQAPLGSPSLGFRSAERETAIWWQPGKGRTASRSRSTSRWRSLSLRSAACELSFYLPRLGMASLLLCIVSGVVLTFQYQPFGNVFKNVEEITTVIPYGFFFRSLHYASGQLFVILTLLHVVEHFLRRRYVKYSPGHWVRLVVPVALCFLILLTGFILKGDKEGIYAGSIFHSLLRSIPLAGETVAGLMIRPGEAFFWLPYLHHCFFLPILVMFLINDHVRRWIPRTGFLFVSTAALFAYSLVVKMSLDIPPDAATGLVKGPWFFLGLQMCLSTLPPFIAGVALPFGFLALLLLLPHLKGRLQATGHYTILAFSLLYACLSVLGHLFMEQSWTVLR